MEEAHQASLDSELDILLNQKMKSLDYFLSKPAVVKTFGDVIISQHLNVIDKMRAQSMSKIEALALNDKIHDFLQHLFDTLVEAPTKHQKANYTQFLNDKILKGNDRKATDEVVAQLIDYSKERLDYFIKLDCNQGNDKRLNALISYRKQLDKFQYQGIDAIKYLIEKGEALESWQ